MPRARLLAGAPTSAGGGKAQVLRPDGLCSDYPASATATFADADLEAAVGAALSIGARENLTCGLVSGMAAFSASGPGPVRFVSGSPEWPDPDYGFEDLTGMQNLTGLTRLTMNNRWITDISALRGLTNLRTLELTGTLVTDLRPLSGLPDILYIDLRYNADLSDIQPLLENPGIGPGDIVELRLTSVTCDDQARLAAKGVEVRTELFSACR